MLVKVVGGRGAVGVKVSKCQSVKIDFRVFELYYIKNKYTYFLYSRNILPQI